MRQHELYGKRTPSPPSIIETRTADRLAGFFILRTIRMVKRSRRERKLEPEDALELERSYLEALLRVEAHAAEVAHELGLAGLKERIIVDRRHAEQRLLELLVEQGAVTERQSGGAPDAL